MSENLFFLMFSGGSKGNIKKKRIINPHHRKVLLEHLESRSKENFKNGEGDSEGEGNGGAAKFSKIKVGYLGKLG